MTRGDRLNAEKRVKEKVKRMIKQTWSKFDSNLVIDKKFVGRVAHAPHSCSGRCCGNPRKYEKGVWKNTIQEMKQNERDQT
jgi:hypothetical protein